MKKIDLDLIKRAYEDFQVKRASYKKMTDYYEGRTDAMRDYQMITSRSNNKVSTNFIQNFVDEEVSYSVGNDVAYVSKSDNKELSDEVSYNLSKLSRAHDIVLLEKMLITSISYEIYYVDTDGDFNAFVVSANEGLAIYNELGEVEYFLREFKRKYDDTVYLDIYTDRYVHHYNEDLEEIGAPTRHGFSSTPVGVATYNIGEDNRHKTIYSAIKGLQDAYEVVLSDITNEISDFRNAYLHFMGVRMDEEDLLNMKRMGAIQTENGKVEWLTKDINSDFIELALTTLEEKMYQLTKHINHSDKSVTMTSGVAIKNRMLGLQQKCKLNQNALEDCIKTRLRFLMEFLYIKKGVSYDYKDIKVIFSANLPSDDLLTADMISKVGDRISNETAIAQLSFIDDPQHEIEKREMERLLEASSDFESLVDSEVNEES